MNLLGIGFFNKQDNINFKAKYINYKTLNNLPKTPCACCGTETIPVLELNKIWAKITFPLSKLIKEGKLDRYKEKFPEIWDKIVELATRFPKKSFDSIILDENIAKETKKSFSDIFKAMDESTGKTEEIDPEAGFHMLSSIQNNCRIFLKKASTIIPSTKKLENSIETGSSEIDKEIFQYLKLYAQKYPDLSLSEIVQLPEVYKHHKTKDHVQKVDYFTFRNFQLNEISKLTNKLNPELFNEIETKVREILSDKYPPKIKISEIKELYKTALKRNCRAKQSLIEKVMNEIEKIPTNYNTANSYFVQAKEKNLSDGYILGPLFKKYMSTFEHIVAGSKGGTNSIYNGIILCQNCNISRGNRSYAKLISAFPRMPINTYKQLEHVMKAIEKGKLPENFLDYPIKIAERLDSQTGHIINLTIPVIDYSKRLARKNEKKLAKAKEEKIALSKEIYAKKKKQEVLKKALEKTKAELTQCYRENESLITEETEAKKLQEEINTYLKKKNK